MEMFVPPLPAPSNVRGHQLVALVDVDVNGRVVGEPRINETKNRDYNRKLIQLLKTMRFYPAVLADGTPIKATAEVSFGF
jgi:hypothetical protein